VIDSKYFKRSEFACKCGCGAAHVSPVLVELLDQARAAAGFPFFVTSGVRCAAHNAKAGGKPDSAHLYGYAADIACTLSGPRRRIVRGMLSAGAPRIGVHRSFVHVDVDPTKPQDLMWLY
jgi:uncharacterized protein YcbK (DUF882 family)